MTTAKSVPTTRGTKSGLEMPPSQYWERGNCVFVREQKKAAVYRRAVVDDNKNTTTWTGSKDPPSAQATIKKTCGGVAQLTVSSRPGCFLRAEGAGKGQG